MKKHLCIILITSTLFGCNNENIEKQETDDKQFEEDIDQEWEKTAKEVQKREEESKKYDEYWNDPNYDYYAYKLFARTEGERDGTPEYYYTGSLVTGYPLELHNINSSSITKETKEVFRFWRYGVDFTPKSGEIILVKFPKENYDEYEDIKIVYVPTGEFFWSHE